jgi:hypothetical protein
VKQFKDSFARSRNRRVPGYPVVASFFRRN